MVLRGSSAMRHIWFDPGNTTGWAEFVDDQPVRMGTLEYPSELLSFLNILTDQRGYWDLIGYENYRLRPEGHDQGWTPTWSEVIPIRVIGMIEFAGYLSGGPKQILRSQDPSVKPAGYGYAGLGKYNPDKSGMHMQDAIAHGAFYWMEVHCAVRSSSSAKAGRVPSFSPTRGIRPRRRT